MLNKQIGSEFGTAEKTIKVQRGRVMQKLGAQSVTDIVRLVERLRACGHLPPLLDCLEGSADQPGKLPETSHIADFNSLSTPGCVKATFSSRSEFHNYNPAVGYTRSLMLYLVDFAVML